MTDGGTTATLDRVGSRHDAHVVSLDALRAVAALGVVLTHVYQIFLLWGLNVEWARAGDAGVSVFFVLSGFLIGAAVLRPRSFDRRSFGFRRAARILPLYYVALLIALVLLDPTPLFTAAGRADVVAHGLLVHGVSRGMRYSIIGIWWTLSVEFLFYLLMALIGPWFRHRVGGWALAASMVVIGVAWRGSVWSSDPQDVAYLVQQLPGVADLFGMGMLLALAVRTERFQRVVERWWVRAALLVATAVWLPVVLRVYHDRYPGYWSNATMVTWWPFALALGVVGLITVMRAHDAVLGRVVTRTGLAYLGRVSFGVYLMHPFVIRALALAWFPRTPAVPAVPFVLFTIAGTVVLAAVFHHAIEWPAMAWARRRTSATVGT